MLAQSSEFFELLKRIDPEFFGVVLILGIIGTFVTCIVAIVSLARTWNNTVVMRLNQNLVRELLKQGYSVEDVERLAYGGSGIGRHLRGFVQSAKSRFGRIRLARMHRRNEYANCPVPPVKQAT